MQPFNSPTQENIFNNYFSGAPSKKLVETTVGNIPQQGVPVDSSSLGYRANGNTDVEGFTDKLKELLDNAWEDNWGEFTIDEPTGNDPETMNFPVITFDMIHRTPSKGKIGLKARPTEIILDPENPDYTLILHRQWFDCITEYTIFHSTNRDARALSTRFEIFLETYRGFFKEAGVSEMIFQEEVDSRLSKKYKKGVPSTCLRYLMVLERISVERVKTTKEIRSQIQANKSGQPKEAGLEFFSR